jgi:hypothetical protein
MAHRHLLWGTAAALLLGAALGGFWVGRAQRAPVAEATLALPQGEAKEILPEAPFPEGDEDLAKLKSLPPEPSRTVMDRMEARKGKGAP